MERPTLLTKDLSGLDVFYWQDPPGTQWWLEASRDGGNVWEPLQPTITSRAVTLLSNGTYQLGPRYKSVVPNPALPDNTLLRFFTLL